MVTHPTPTESKMSRTLHRVRSVCPHKLHAHLAVSVRAKGYWSCCQIILHYCLGPHWWNLLVRLHNERRIKARLHQLTPAPPTSASTSARLHVNGDGSRILGGDPGGRGPARWRMWSETPQTAQISMYEHNWLFSLASWGKDLLQSENYRERQQFWREQNLPNIPRSKGQIV